MAAHTLCRNQENGALAYIIWDRLQKKSAVRHQARSDVHHSLRQRRSDRDA